MEASLHGNRHPFIIKHNKNIYYINHSNCTIKITIVSLIHLAFTWQLNKGNGSSLLLAGEWAVTGCVKQFIFRWLTTARCTFVTNSLIKNIYVLMFLWETIIFRNVVDFVLRRCIMFNRLPYFIDLVNCPSSTFCIVCLFLIDICLFFIKWIYTNESIWIYDGSMRLLPWT